MTLKNEADQGFKRDETPYLVFSCSKCKQYQYVKTTQKTRKCLRCKRAHTVESYLDKGEIVKGMTVALELVKEKQNKLGGIPDFTSENDFIVARNIKPPERKKKKPQKRLEEAEVDYYDNFLCMLDKIKEQYSEFPAYILRLMAPEFEIPNRMIIPLKNKALKAGILINTKDNYFKTSN